MHLSTSLASLALALASLSHAALPTIYLAGDSKTALGGGGTGTQGWGEYLKYSIPPSVATINNSATAGRSARSYTREGRFQWILNVVKPDDWVVIEFGTNDGGTPYPASADTGRADCPGSGNETCPTVYLNQTEIVQTYVTYISNATENFLAKGAKVIIASPTPDDPWTYPADTAYDYIPTAYTAYSILAAQNAGAPSSGVWYVPHSAYAAQLMFNLGSITNITQYFPLDHGHTAPYLASLVAQSFVLGLKCGTSPMQELVQNATSRIEGSLLGTCIAANASLPI